MEIRVKSGEVRTYKPGMEEFAFLKELYLLWNTVGKPLESDDVGDGTMVLNIEYTEPSDHDEYDGVCISLSIDMRLLGDFLIGPVGKECIIAIDTVGFYVTGGPNEINPETYYDWRFQTVGTERGDGGFIAAVSDKIHQDSRQSQLCFFGEADTFNIHN